MNESTTNSRRTWFNGIFICLIILLRFYATGHDEFMTIKSDSLNYARNAEHYLQQSGFSALPPQMPGLSILAMMSSEFGIPFKIFQDLLLIIVGVFAWRLVRQTTGSSVCAHFVFLTTVLNPWFIQSSRFLLSEPLTSILLLAVFVSAGYVIRHPTHWKPYVGASLASVGLVLTRPETPLLLAFWLIVALVIYMHEGKLTELATRKSRLAKAILVAIPMMMAIGSTQIVSKLHQRHFGINAMTVTDAPGIQDLMNALYSIVPEEEIRFAPVTFQSLAQACDECPTLNLRRERLLSTSTSACKAAERNLDLKNEFGTWLNWHLANSFQGVNPKTEQEMLQAAAEIRLAQSEGRLSHRFAHYPINPLWDQWLPELPTTFCSLVKTSFTPNLTDRVRAKFFRNRLVRNTVHLGFYNEGLVRRNGIGSQEELRLFFTCPESGFRRARVFSKDKKMLAKSLIDQNPSQYEFGFSIRDFEGLAAVFPLTVQLHQNKDQTIPDVSFEIPRCSEYRRFVVDLGEQRTEEWLASASLSKPGVQRTALRRWIIQHSRTGLLILIGLSFFIGSLRGIDQGQLRLFYYMVLMGLSLLVLRCLYYVLVDVWLSWSGCRYVEPNNILANATTILLCFAIGASLNRKFSFLRSNRFSRFAGSVEASGG